MSYPPYQVLYAKFNSVRRPEFRVTTEICEDACRRYVRKHASTEAAKAHLKGILRNRESLSDYFRSINVIVAEADGDDIVFPYVKGRTLAQQLDARHYDRETFVTQVNEKLESVLSVREQYEIPFRSTETFEAVFGPIEFDGVPAMSPANLDSLLSNFIENETGIHCIDYEWVCHFPVPVAFIRFRILLYLYVTQAHAQLNGVSLEEMIGWFGYSEEEFKTYWEMDDRFQQYVHGEDREYIYTERYKKENKLIGDMERSMKAMAADVSAKRAIIHDKDVHIINQDAQIQRLTISFQEISNSFFWRISAPARTTLDALKRLVRKNEFLHISARTAKDALRHGPLDAQKNLRKYLEAKKRATLALSWPPEQELARQRQEAFPREIRFSILVPLYNTPEDFLREMIQSVQDQTYQNWELCLVDGSGEDYAYVGRVCRELAAKDVRIRYKKLAENLGISGNTNACIEMATGNYIALFDHDDILHPSALYEIMKVICEQDADYIYTDEVTFQSPDRKKIITLHYKPDFAPDNLLANNYICHFSVFSVRLLKEVGTFRHEYDGSQDHDIILRLTYAARKVVHIPKVLYWWRSHPQSVSQNIGAKQYAVDAAKRAVHDFLWNYQQVDAVVESTRAFPTIFQIKYPIIKQAKVSIVIPNKDHVEDLRRCVDSILNRSTYGNYEIVIVENNSQTDEVFAYYSLLEQNKSIRVLHYKGEFNYSRINNWAVRQCDGEYVVLLNNDTEVITPDWLENMMMYAQREDVGAVGAKLYFPDGRIQHAGVVLKMGNDRIAAHAYYGANHDHIGYMGRLCYAQDVSVVTAACLMIRKAKYDEVGGLDESFAVAYNDVDFCLKLRGKSYLNIFTPFSELYHHESASRGYETGEKLERFKRECGLFKEKWGDVLEAGDSYFNPNLSLDSPMFEPL